MKPRLTRHALTVALLGSGLLFGSAVTAQTAEHTASPSHGHAAQADSAATRKELEQMQAKMGQLAARMATLSSRLAEDDPRLKALEQLTDPQHGLLGVVLRPSAKGARIIAVTPDGPADKAGLVSGDVIMAVDGHALPAAMPPNPQDREHQQAPRDRHHPWPMPPHRLLGSLKPGQAVTLTVLHDGKTRQLTLKPVAGSGPDWPHMLGMLGHLPHRFGHMPDFAGMPWWGLHLAPLDGELGSYFGTHKGALVLSSDAHRYPGLHSGDVIIAIDGHAVGDPPSAMRALMHAGVDRQPGTKHGKGNTVSITVRRHNQQHTLSLKVPDMDHRLPPPPPSPHMGPRPPMAPPMRRIDAPAKPGSAGR
ncbi:PDZ domain-containing protein [Oleiagrimonas sp. C23AA]|uniref:PDZ domain-containing protein n=1 Tax=Oleiagrimonas sp. C23AA TaxID=2719047 RepID=UPI00141D8043|nr:PDZ domain-containing protein [Oleiagrimonas sp. C23AA]NII12046.1 PDZ domain-containing protein [Oleiagrimonas sp. C23AA]